MFGKKKVEKVEDEPKVSTREAILSQKPVVGPVKVSEAEPVLSKFQEYVKESLEEYGSSFQVYSAQQLSVSSDSEFRAELLNLQVGCLVQLRMIRDVLMDIEAKR